MLADPVSLAARHGLSAEAVTVLVDREDKLVARVETTRGALVLKVDGVAGSLAREVAAIRRLAAIGVPVPDLLVYEPHPPAYLMSTWIDGKHWVRPARSPRRGRRGGCCGASTTWAVDLRTPAT